MFWAGGVPLVGCGWREGQAAERAADSPFLRHVVAANPAALADANGVQQIQFVLGVELGEEALLQGTPRVGSSLRNHSRVWK